MSKIKTVEPLVQEVLEENPETRDDDFLLTANVYYKLNPAVTTLSFTAVMLCHKELALPALESISRARRKLQKENEHLRASEEVQNMRAEEELEYIKYAKDLD